MSITHLGQVVPLDISAIHYNIIQCIVDSTMSNHEEMSTPDMYSVPDQPHHLMQSTCAN